LPVFPAIPSLRPIASHLIQNSHAKLMHSLPSGFI
jgi:hypothetical protein